MNDVLGWIEDHPVYAALLGIGGVLVLLWLFGAFGAKSNNSGGNNLAAAYYAAEAAQTTAGTQLNIATVQAARDVAIANTQASGAEAIATTQANMETTLGQQNADTATAISHDQTIATMHSADIALATTNNNNFYAYQTADSANKAGLMQTVLGTIIPQELKQSGGGAAFALPGLGSGAVNVSGTLDINQLVAQGYTPQQAQQLAGVA